MEVESEDEDDERPDRGDGHPSQPDQDTQVQDMDEVRTNVVIHCRALHSLYFDSDRYYFPPFDVVFSFSIQNYCYNLCFITLLEIK